MTTLNRDEHEILRRLWPDYFETEEGYMEQDSRLNAIEIFRNALRKEGPCSKLLSIIDISAVTAVLFDLPSFSDLIPIANFIEELIENPDIVINCLGLSLCLVRNEYYPMLRGAQKILARFVNTPDPTDIGQLKSLLVGKFVTVVGNVVRVGNVSPLVTAAEFKCGRCEAIIPRRFSEGKYQPPTRCAGAYCKARVFELLRETAITIDYQRLRIQEIEGDSTEPGRIPRTLEIEVKGDLVDCCIPGDVITASGIVRSFNAELATGRTGKAAKSSGLYLLYLDANSIVNNRIMGKDEHAGEKTSHRYTPEDLVAIRTIASEPSPFELIVASLCPGIFGHELVKAGLALALFGGTSREGGNEEEVVSIRCDPHVLLVGDPGLGKSQMLQAASAAAPRSVYVCGNTTSTTGLTVTLTKDGGDIGLEAGALVLADQGVCCIDEFDKMSCDPTALLESMEQQRISIAKGGIVASLSARCSVIAAANPTGGHYNRGRTVAENIKMGAALLSRFDLVFVLIDKPDDGHDRHLSEHIMRLHATKSASQDGFFVASQARPRNSVSKEKDEPIGKTLSQRLRQSVAQIGTDLVPHDLLRKYIAYARRYCRPRMTVEAARVLQALYLEMRKEAGRSMPITTRQLESLVRLSQARAKADLREFVTEDDAKDVVDMMQESMLEAHLGNAGTVDFVRGRGVSMPSQIKNFLSILNKEADRKGSALFQERELKAIADRLPTPVSDFFSFLEVLRSECYLLKRGAKIYQAQTCSKSGY